MDFMTIGGFLGGVLVLVWGIKQGTTLSAFVNLHGVLIVGGGTCCAAMINSSIDDLFGALRAASRLLFTPEFKSCDEAIPVLVQLCRRARTEGIRAAQDAGASAGGFFARAMDACVVLNDKTLAREALERDIVRMRSRHTEVGNVFRVCGLLAPMFGLLGTLIGIISVLRSLSDPAQAGPAMAVAISSAFYGILLANLVCVPIANKLRSRSIAEALEREVILNGVLEIIFTQRAPLALEAQLLGFVRSRREGRPVGAPAPAGAPARAEA
jgi:chemotaxis protein MotA